MELISLKNTAGIEVKTIYKRIAVNAPVMNFSYKIDYGFGYLLRRIRVKYPEINPPLGVADFAAWAPATVYALDDVVTGTGGGVNPSVFMCTTAGTSDGSAPTWNHKRGETTTETGGVTWIALDQVLDIGHFTAPLKAEILDNANNTPRQQETIPIDLMASPGRTGSIYRKAPSPVDQNGYGINFSSNQALFSSTLNFLYRYADIIWVSFSNIESVTSIITPTGATKTVPAFWAPGFIDVVLDGYYVPEKAFTMWKGAQI